MLNFIEAMSKAKTIHINNELGNRIYNHIPTNSGYYLSIQCSKYHYCSPKELLNLDAYDEFEVAIFWEGNFSYPEILNDFARKEELDNYYDGYILAYVPKDLIEDLYNYLNSK